MDLSKFWVVAVISNPVRYAARYRLYKQFEAMVKDTHANLLTVEIAFGDRPFEVTERDNPLHLQFRSFDELWHKENMINLAFNYISQVDPSWEYVAWVDADIQFVRRDWAEETVHQLQHYMIVQMFSQAIDMGPNGEMMHVHHSFASCWHESGFKTANGITSKGYYGTESGGKFFHPGYCWAARREAIEALGGILDTPAILGAGDHHFALSLIGKADQAVPKGLHPNYYKQLNRYEDLALTYIKKDIGFVPGMINHFWHGKKKDRGYWDRWKILVDNQFDPEVDIKRDSQGLFQLEVRNERQRMIRDQIRAYFRSRNEDSIDV